MKPHVIFFAGATAAGKSDMAYYLSEQLGWPIFSTDAVRRDAKVSKDVVDIHDALEEFELARDKRIQAMFKGHKSFIVDASVDRKWPDYKKSAQDSGYNWILISFDLPKDRILKNKAMFDHIEPDEMFEQWIADHQKFLNEHSEEAQLHITHDNYSQRNDLAVDLVRQAIKE